MRASKRGRCNSRPNSVGVEMMGATCRITLSRLLDSGSMSMSQMTFSSD